MKLKTHHPGQSELFLPTVLEFRVPKDRHQKDEAIILIKK